MPAAEYHRFDLNPGAGRSAPDPNGQITGGATPRITARGRSPTERGVRSLAAARPEVRPEPPPEDELGAAAISLATARAPPLSAPRYTMTPRLGDAPATGQIDEGPADQLHLLGASLRRISDELRSTEARQLKFDTRLAQVDVQFLALSEEQSGHRSHLARLISTLGEQLVGGAPAEAHNSISSRLAALERGQRAVAEAMQRSLRTAIATQQDQQICGMRLAEFEKEQQTCGKRLAEFEKDNSDKLAALQKEVKEALVPLPVLLGRGVGSDHREGLASAAALDKAKLERAQPGIHNAVVPEVEHMSKIEKHFEGQLCMPGVGQHMPHEDVSTIRSMSEPDAEASVFLDTQPSTGCPQLVQLKQSLDAQLGSGLADVRRRIEALQETLEDKLAARLGPFGRQLQSASGRIDRLGEIFQDGLSKTEAHEVRLDLLRAGFETQEKRISSLSSNVEQAISVGSQSKQTNEALESLQTRVQAQAKVLEELVTISTAGARPTSKQPARFLLSPSAADEPWHDEASPQCGSSSGEHG